MRSITALRLALMAGLVLAAALASTAVAWRFGFAEELGLPLLGRLYPPWAVVGWWQAWGHAEPYRRLFLQALSSLGVVFVLPLLAVRLLQVHGRLRVDNRPKDDGLGAASELRRKGQLRAHGPGIVLGKEGRRILRSDGDSHVGVFGATRSGKGATVGIPTALSHPGSMLVFDPKNAVLGIVGRRRAEFGPVHGLNPTDRTAACFNPLLELRVGDHLIGDCQTGGALLTNAGKGQGPKDPFWDNSAGYLVSGLLYHARRSADPTLAHVWRLLQDLDAQRYPKNLPDEAARILEGFRKREPKLRDSMVTTAIIHLRFLADPLVQHATGESDFVASDLTAAEHPVTIGYAVPPAHRERLTPLTRLVLQSLIMPQLEHRRHTSDGRPKLRRALVKIDEFPSLRYLELMENSLAEAAEYGLRFLLIAQGIEDVYKHYGPYQNITGNCGTIALMPGFSRLTLEEAAKWAGHRAVAQAGKQNVFGPRGSSSTSESEALRAVLDPRDMLLRARDEVLVFTTGGKPTYLKKIRYWQDRTFKGLFDPPPPPRFLPLLTRDQEELPPWLLTHRV